MAEEAAPLHADRLGRDGMSTCIVCGIDGSGAGWRAAMVTATLARRLRLPAVLVHVTEDVEGSHASGPRGPWRGWRTKTRVDAVALERWFPAGARFVHRAGDAARELLLVAQQEDAELVVVAAAGSGRRRALLVGGVASALIHKSNCPVVVVPGDRPPPADAELTSSVVCPVETREADDRVLRYANGLAKRLGATLHAVHGYAHNGAPASDAHRTAAERTLALALAAANVEALAHVRALLTADAVLRVAERQPGMIVVGLHEACDHRCPTEGHAALPIIVDAVGPVVVLPPRAR
jgi:nucleotide-binding universal stress UspA family protein